MKPAIVLDKSYLQGTSTRRMHELAESHRLLVTDSLFYEILSNEEDRAKCFAKFPPTENPVDLVTHVGGYLKKEISLRKPAPRPSQSIIRERFVFNPSLLEAGYELPPEAAAAQLEKEQEVRVDVGALIRRAKAVPKMFPLAFVGTDEEKRLAIESAETLIATDKDALLSFYGGFRAPKGHRKPPPSRYLDENWALYRWVQVHLLFALDLATRQLSNLVEPLPVSLYEKIEHDALDAEYLIVGALEGSFATFEKKLQRWFRIMCPTGLLVTQ